MQRFHLIGAFCLRHTLALVMGAACFQLAGYAEGNHSELSPGHSSHGDAFNEGPRQKAYLMEGMPKIQFPITTPVPEAQKFFNQGVGQLHGFWYFEAERTFRQVAALDTNCVMAMWGMAMANVYNGDRARSFVEKAVLMTNGVGRRECLYIDSLAKFYGVDTAKVKKAEKSAAPTGDERHRTYVRSLEQIVEEFPEDTEAKAFLTFKIWENGERQSIVGHTAVDALAKQVLAVDPMHPVHHARIHLWNDEADRRALESAARCGQGSPGIAHMWHMPGHTYSGLKRYADAAWQQEASARVDHAYMMRNGVLPDQIHNYAHNNDWLVKNLSYLGRVHDALDLAKNLIELPRHPKYNSLAKPLPRKAGENKSVVQTNLPPVDTSVRANDNRQNSAVKGRARLLDTLVRWELWDELIELSSTMYLEPTEVLEEEAKRVEALGIALFNKKDMARGDKQVAELEAILKKQKAARVDKMDEAETKARAEKKSDDKVAESMTDTLKSENRKLKTTESSLAELKLYRALAAGDNDDEARRLFDTAKDIPKERLAQIYLKLGDNDKAETVAREAVEGGTNQVQILANYVDVLLQVGKKDDADKAFEFLRTAATQADLEMPVLKRLQPIAERLKLSKDWRHPFTPATDIGSRPPLDQLGPFRWQPSPAHDWALQNATGKTIFLHDYRGKPVVMIFYLGYGCSHCLEQLNAFSPMVDRFQKAGISLIAVSTDSPEGLRKTFERSKTGDGFPFPIVSDQNLDTFKAYRAFDDFENIPLHGTFLIDGEGLVRWQDISFEPFAQPDFLLSEAQRLLKLPSNPQMAGTTTKPPARSPKGDQQLQKRTPQS